ncbi:MAG: acyl carrier protein [Bryobacterales bacterium]|nr:acyl carrier protein [Bryobacterales bacterium]
MPNDHLEIVTQVLCSVGGLPQLAPDQDFYDAGFTSIMALPLLMELEGQFNVTIPDDLFIGARTARSLSEVIAGLQN